MSREKIKKLLPIIQAYADGAEIQVAHIDADTNNTEWLDINPWRFDEYETYRVKPQSAYRSFLNADECWNEMQKHQPFGWVKSKEGKNYQVVTCILDEGEDAEADNILFDCESGCVFFAALEQYTFADGTPFGIKEDKENQ